MKNKRIPKVTIIKATNPNYKQAAEILVKIALSKMVLKKDVS
ncbi:hypothetical protein SAMN05878494_3157 [Bacillus cereus]|nr:hypothetical protein [Bacillus nitratireducens]SIR22274.1 hypothetical protein SAMN05878494_3157 [Bacillus cereus]